MHLFLRGRIVNQNLFASNSGMVDNQSGVRVPPKQHDFHPLIWCLPLVLSAHLFVAIAVEPLRHSFATVPGFQENIESYGFITISSTEIGYSLFGSNSALLGGDLLLNRIGTKQMQDLFSVFSMEKTVSLKYSISIHDVGVNESAKQIFKTANDKFYF